MFLRIGKKVYETELEYLGDGEIKIDVPEGVKISDLKFIEVLQEMPTKDNQSPQVIGEYGDFTNIVESISDKTFILSCRVIEEVEQALDEAKEAKIAEISNATHVAIVSGIEIEVLGEKKHFSFGTDDQLNVFALTIRAQTETHLPYHADGEPCTMYPSTEILKVMSAFEQHKTWHVTYGNALKVWVNTMQTKEEVQSVQYGVEIPQEHQSQVLQYLLVQERRL
jgi:hypothetical protein